MLKKFFKENWLIVTIEAIVFIAFIAFFGNFGDMIIDSFREAYIPWQMYEGKCLYKDIFCIYPPLAYIINALLFKIFGVSLNVLYFAGLLATMGIIYLVYRLSDIFLDKYTTAGVCLLLISSFALSPNVFNSIFPYSYGILYGLLFILLSVFCLIEKRFPLAYLFYSFAICSKYEFILLLPLLILVSRKTDWIKNLIALVLPPIFTLIILLITGTDISNLKTSFELICLMGGCKTLQFFYSSMGLIFRWELIPLYFINLGKFIIPANWNLYQEVFIWAFPVISILFVFRYKALDYTKKIFIIASLLISIKVFFALTLQSYGVYFLAFALISLGILIPDKFRKLFATVLLMWTLIIGINNISVLSKKDFNEIHNMAEYLKNTPQDAKIAVYPEGLGINFLSKREGDNKFYSLIPLYLETFGESLIIKHLDITKPEYIVINNFDTSAYYFEKFGYDYAIEIKKWIDANYTQIKDYEGLYKYNIYKLNPKR